MYPVLCVGETLKEFAAKKTTAVLTKQLKADLDSIDASKLDFLTIAYEPI
jgi:triosephosphate isomerase